MEDNFSMDRVRRWRGWGGSGNNVTSHGEKHLHSSAVLAQEVSRVVVGFLRGHRLRGWGPVAELEGAENVNA